MKLPVRIKRVHIIFIVTFIVYSVALVNIVQAVTTASGEPGSETNPLVAQDYVDGKIGELTARIQELNKQVSDLTKQVEDLTRQKENLIKQAEDLAKQAEEQAKGSKFEAVMVGKGKQLVAGASTEIVVRTGKALAIAGVNGDGLSDLISGIDLQTGAEIPRNHLLLIPRDDGRGFKAMTDVWILIKGSYVIK